MDIEKHYFPLEKTSLRLSVPHTNDPTIPVVSQTFLGEVTMDTLSIPESNSPAITETIAGNYSYPFSKAKQVSKSSPSHKGFRTDCSKKVLIIVPGYSVSTPPKIGDHRFYIDALRYDPETNPFGYRRIYVFDLYSEKNGRCNFKADLKALTSELWLAISSESEGWQFEENCTIDFIGASMGGILVRKLIQEHMSDSNKLHTTTWGTLTIRTVVLIATPNFGCHLVDRLQSPILQFFLRLFLGKDNFSESDQVLQLAVGNSPVFGSLLHYITRKKSAQNRFLEELNNKDHTPGNIRWITLRGTKSKWYSQLVFNRSIPNDGVVAADSVTLNGAENIADKDLGSSIAWDHRDLYQADSVCQLLHAVLVLNLQLSEYLSLRALEESRFSLKTTQKQTKKIQASRVSTVVQS